jgi:Family of unknown function (DUF6264)
MTEHEAARPGNGEHGADAAGTPPPRDERPRPQYGEYAPEGWTPPRPPAAASAGQAQLAAAAAAAAASAGKARDDGLNRAERPIDRTATIALLLVGLLGAWLSISVLQALPQSMQLLHTQEGLPDYTPGPEIPGLILAGTIVQVVMWVAAAAGSIALMRARRPSFWLPLVAGVLAAIALFTFTVVAIMGDPTLLEHLSTTGL